MRLKFGLFLAALLLSACAQQPEPAPAARTGSPNFQQGQPANPDAAVRLPHGRN